MGEPESLLTHKGVKGAIKEEKDVVEKQNYFFASFFPIKNAQGIPTSDLGAHFWGKEIVVPEEEVLEQMNHSESNPSTGPAVQPRV